MRLLNVRTLEFQEHSPPISPYAIASHRWKGGTEVTMVDVRDKCNTEKEGFIKVVGFAEYIKVQIPHVEWLWIDTCCVDQKSSQEVSEAINSMFEWYRNAEVCLAYLPDVSQIDDLERFKGSEWFRRGWTLQELLAPRTVVFLTADWRVIGHKGGTSRGKSGIDVKSGQSLTSSIEAASRIPARVLNDFEQSKGFAIEEKLEWMAGRETTRAEDMSYSLLGIFGLTMSVRYGEGGEGARERLIAKIRKRMENSEQPPTHATTHRGALIKPSSNVPFRRDSDFVDRGTIIDIIVKKLALPAGRVALVGLGGAGKSQLAIEYTYRVRKHPSERWIFWIHASTAARFEQGVRDIADLVKIEGREDPKADILKLVCAWLREGASGPWVVILDNVDDASFLVESRARSEDSRGGLSLVDHLPVCDHGSVLITSRSESAALKLVERSDMIAVDLMDRETAIALLEKKLGKQEDEKSAWDLVEILEYMPLAITQAAAYITQRRSRCSVGQYVDKMRKSDRSKQSILDFEAGDLRRDSKARNSIILTWQISFEHIRSIRRSAADLLSLMSFCDRQEIPEALIRAQGSKEEVGNGIQSVGGYGVESTSHEEQDVGDDDSSDDASLIDSDASSKDGFDEDIAMLEGYSFVSATKNSSVFEMHALVQLATRKWLKSQNQLERWKGQFVYNLCDVLPSGSYENWTQCQIFYPHAQSAATLKLRDEQALLKWATVMYNAAWFAWSTGHIGMAEAMAVQSLTVRAGRLGNDDERTLSSMAMVALARKASGRWDEAADLQEQVVEVRKKVLGAEHPDTLTSMNNLALTYGDQGRWDEAEELGVQVVESCKKVLGAEHPDTLMGMSNLALTYADQGRWDEAEELEVQVIESRKKVLGAEHPDTLTSIRNLALTYRNQGRWSEAEELGVQVVESCKKVLGAEHPDTLMGMSNLALTYADQGRWDEAEELEVQVIESRKKVLGAEHPDTLTSINNLALTYADQGRWAEAEELEVQELEICKRVLGAEHPDTLTSMGNLALTYADQGRWAEAEEIEVQELEICKRVLGAEHPDTLTSIRNLALTYWNQGRWSEAEELGIQVVESCKKVLGAEHPDTLIGINNLAHTFKSLGRDQAARELLGECASVSSRVLGVSHPLTVSRVEVLQEWTHK